MRDIGANIRRARTRRRLTQDDLAQTVHTTRQTISNYETGRSRPDVETLQRLADALGVELTELLDGAPSADARRAARPAGCGRSSGHCSACVWLLCSPALFCPCPA